MYKDELDVIDIDEKYVPFRNFSFCKFEDFTDKVGAFIMDGLCAINEIYRN